MPADAPTRSESSFEVIGVLHLLPLPGAPRPSPGLTAVVERAVADARALATGGVRSAILENLGDAPFTGGRVSADVVAAMTRIALAVRQEVPEIDLGINVLRNDPLAALGIAAAVEASFIRVNVLSGATWTDQGLITGTARELLLARRRLVADGVAPVKIAADVQVKHGAPAGESRLELLAHDTAGRGGADVLIVTGSATGSATALEDVRTTVEAAPGTPVWVGSGVTAQSVADVRRAGAAAAIVGTWLHEGGVIEAPLCAHRTAQLIEAASS